MSFIEGLGQQAATTAMGGIFGLALGGINDRRQIKQQEKLQAMQIRGNKELTDYNTAKQLQMWKDTNYKPQVDQLKMAGLNPGLIYGMGGAGGATTNIAQGSVSAGEGPRGGGEIQAMTQMGIQSALTAAQARNLDADTELKKVEAAQKAGPGTELIQTQTASLAQGINNQKAAETLTRIETEIAQVKASVARQTIIDQMRIIENAAEKGTTEISQLQLSNQLDFSQMQDKIKLLRAQAVGALIENALKDAHITKTQQETEKLANDITLGWETLSNEQQRTRIQQFTAEYMANHPGLMNVLGGAIQRLADGVSKPLQGNKIQK